VERRDRGDKRENRHARRHIPKRREYGGAPQTGKDLKQHVGIFSVKRQGGFLGPCHRKDPFSGVHLEAEQSKGFNEGDVIVYSIARNGEFQFIKNLGSIHLPKTYAQMGIYAYHLPHTFHDAELRLADKGIVPELGKRTDLRDIPLVTIDGADAKDFDDAVFAMPDPDPRNEGGWRAIVAIADVSHYVTPGDALDKEAYLRGNSVYFVDRVVPMLPEKLSNNLCSLRPNEDRACLAVDMIIDKNGKVKSHRFKRGLMKSKARLTYDQVENAINGKTDETTALLMDDVILPLYGCYKSLKKARDLRGTIEVETTENTFILDNEGSIQTVKAKKRLESHQLIEELMIAANVAAAKTLQTKDWPTIYRTHERPDKSRLQNLYALAKNLKISVKKFDGKNIIGSINDLLHAVKALPYFRLFNELVLRSQAQARYSPHNMGHFGLNLSAYCHFTSPIRRYADLVVHRALIAALDLGSVKHVAIDLDLADVSEHISKTERIAMEAEREVQNRFMAHYMKDHLGSVFNGIIVGVGIPGIFVELEGIGAQGFIPKQDLDGDYFILNETQHCYVGKRTKKIYQMGNHVRVMVTNADPIICSIGFSLVKDKKAKQKTQKKAKNPERQEHKNPNQKKKAIFKKHKRKSGAILK